MPGTTPCAALPYPLAADPIDVHGDMTDLALAVDAAICGVNGSGVGVIEMWWDNGGVTPPGTLRCEGEVFDGAAWPDLEAHLGSTTLPDLRGRFPRGTDEAGGPFPGEGQVGGWADAQLVGHDHGLGGHTHSIAHDHAAFNATGGSHFHSINHNHAAANTSGAGGHDHSIPTGSDLATNRPTGGAVPTGSGGFSSYYDNFASAADHVHSFNMPNYVGNSGTSTSHTHSINVPSYAGASGPTNGRADSVGGTETNRNIPPFYNVTFIITAVKGTGQ